MTYKPSLFNTVTAFGSVMSVPAPITEHDRSKVCFNMDAGGATLELRMPVLCKGTTAAFCLRNLHLGSLVAVMGRLDFLNHRQQVQIVIQAASVRMLTEYNPFRTADPSDPEQWKDILDEAKRLEAIERAEQ